MAEAELHSIATWTEIGLAALTFVSLFFVTAPYGRHGRKGWGPEISQRLGWVLMELPACVLWLGIYFAGTHALELAPLALMALWQLHYVNRTFVFPFRIKAEGKTTPVSIVATAIVFNTLNAYVNARWVSELGSYPISWLYDARFVIGAVLFVAGFAINQHADQVLMNLRKPGETGYKIPHGGLYRFISCPNYFGEILEWTGWAIATWSLAGLAFALYTIANLAPRALKHHEWYRQKFADYPTSRRALIPFVV
ncbi:3-oxo-5-alpha-steroid 4-dehydrogenase [Sandaracinus amylolyticus]|uniref:3-oxo-5-alpha-steroid 4-dehydrogenase n=2 Tax=Sandaracinus amylolyticus TaxID=927083 RepID=A0A0F6W269_9BACT|nr:3-oxo-5-alpha-steroid 4-dehydrogenase [Sandaracinus amylolyticus]